MDGIKVLDWTMWQFGPVSTMMLGDLGADVIKVESLDGDHGRQFRRVAGASSQLPGGLNAYFESLNRQKRSIALDLKNPKGVEILHRLVAQSDVFVQNFRQGVAERLGMGYEDLIKHSPKLIYGAATGYGPIGPDSDQPAFALTGEARSGSLFWGGPDDGKPYNLGGIADQMAGVMLSYGILGALVARERKGVGQKVDVSHLGSLMWLGGNRYGIALISKNVPRRQDRTAVLNPLWNFYRCEDDRWIAFSMNQSDRYWPPFCKAIGHRELIDDPRFNGMERRAENRVELVRLLDGIFESKPRDAWEGMFAGNGDIIWTRVQDVFDLPDDPQVIANNYIVDYDHPVLGPSKWIQTPVGYSSTPVSAVKAAPAHGANTEEILIESLGCSWEDISKLQEEGVIL
ncbi:MAG: CoA transferase [Dehalococcoidia bacterium]|nr:CoA transferase [Dehalococcoidia bacterium]